VVMLAVVGILVLGAAVRTPPTARSRELSRDRESFLVAADSQTAPKIARGPIDVIQTTAGSFLSVGGFGFAFTALQESIKRSNVGGRARARVPYFVFRASIANGQRWGRVSAGFAGGRALGQALRGKDDSTCSMLGSIFGGIAAAPNPAGVPSSVATFAAFGYFIDSFTANNRPEDSAQQLEKVRAQRARLQKQLEACDREIGRLRAA